MRGFVTIATGADKYYKLAANLLYSYRKYAKDGTPFAIICDRETEETKAFDKVILMESASRSYMDKLLLYKYAPYEELIFIDADSLICSDPTGLWLDFADADDVSCYGCTYPLNSNRGWFIPEGCGKYRDVLRYVIDLHGGIYYLRRTERCRSIFETAIDVAKNYHNYTFNGFTDPADEPVLALSLAIHQSRPCDKTSRILFVPSYRGKLHLDVAGKLYVSGKERIIEVLHFATVNTELFLYQYLVSFHRQGNISQWRYFKIRMQTAPKNIKSVIKHLGGKILRLFFDGDTVNKWKKRLK